MAFISPTPSLSPPNHSLPLSGSGCPPLLRCNLRRDCWNWRGTGKRSRHGVVRSMASHSLSSQTVPPCSSNAFLEVAKLAREKFKEEISLGVKDQDISIGKALLYIATEDEAIMAYNGINDGCSFTNERSNQDMVCLNEVCIAGKSITGWLSEFDVLTKEVEAELVQRDIGCHVVQVVEAVNTVLFETRRFLRFPVLVDSRFSYLHHVLGSSCGTAIMLSVVYMEICKSKTLSMLEYLCIHGSRHIHQRHSNYKMEQLLELIRLDEIGKAYYPSLEIAYPSNMQQIYLAMQDIKYIQHLKKLTVALCSKSCVMPPLSFTLKELKLHHLGLVVLPYLYENKSNDSGSLPSLVSMEISDCPNLLSLAEGLFQRPQRFAALEKLTVFNCQKLRKLPQGSFNKFTSLKKLDIASCPEIEGQLVPEYFLPSTLQVLHIANCGDLETNLSKALESVNSLISLLLDSCKNIRSLPPKEVFSRWKTLDKLELSSCYELTSLESLIGLSSVRWLKIYSCPKLVSAITSPSARKKDETEGMVEDSTIQTSNRPASTQPTSTDPCSSTERKPLLFVDELIIGNPLLLSIEPIRSLSSVKKLTITRWFGMQSLPELPPIREELSLYLCSPELQRRCEQSGEDWPKLSHIPKVFISEAFFRGW